MDNSITKEEFQLLKDYKIIDKYKKQLNKIKENLIYEFVNTDKIDNISLKSQLLLLQKLYNIFETMVYDDENK